MRTHFRLTNFLSLSLAFACLVGAGVLVSALAETPAKDPGPPMHPVTAVPSTGPDRVGEGSVTAYFSPNGGAADALVEEITKARQTILVQQYELSLPSVKTALIAAHQRGVKVTVILDVDELKDDGKTPDTFTAAGVPVFIDAMHNSAHNKILVLDQTVITGSMNMTGKSDKSNAENLLVIHGFPKLVEAYRQNFQLHLAHSRPYVPTTHPDEK
jgi:phosphatidylserine/phosphatidylglycerophosphate/cardiolipin synthase-like enzyme